MKQHLHKLTLNQETLRNLTQPQPGEKQGPDNIPGPSQDWICSFLRTCTKTDMN